MGTAEWPHLDIKKALLSLKFVFCKVYSYSETQQHLSPLFCYDNSIKFGLHKKLRLMTQYTSEDQTCLCFCLSLLLRIEERQSVTWFLFFSFCNDPSSSGLLYQISPCDLFY